MGPIALSYGLAVYGYFLATFCYAIGFVGNLLVPKSIDLGTPPGAAGEPLAVSLLIDAALLGVFAIQHSVMARPAFKRWWTRFVPRAMERSTYVLLASSALALLFWQWRPIAVPVWDVAGTVAGDLLTTVFWCGWALVLISTFLIDHFELFGVKQSIAALRGSPAGEPVFRTPGIYRHVRHPIYLGFLLAFWAAPTMTAAHLLFAAMTTGYVLAGIWFEERDLVAQFGQRYRDYRRQVAMLLPWPRGLHDDGTHGSRPRERRPADTLR